MDLAQAGGIQSEPPAVVTEKAVPAPVPLTALVFGNWRPLHTVLGWKLPRALATLIAAKRRPAALTDIVAAAEFMGFPVTAPGAWATAFQRFFTHGLLAAAGDGYVLTPAAVQLVGGLPRKAEADERVFLVRERLAAWCLLDARFRMIDNPGRIVSTGLNRCIEAAQGRFIVRLDVHTVYAPDYVANAGGVINVYSELTGWSRDEAVGRPFDFFAAAGVTG